jgi:hypothetical protein
MSKPKPASKAYFQLKDCYVEIAKIGKFQIFGDAEIGSSETRIT